MADLSLSRSQLLLLAGTANRPLAEEMAKHLGQPLCAVTIRRFADGEIFVKIDENVRGRDVFIIQPTNPPAENYLELLFLIDAARRASAARTTAVLPYFGFARQDRKDGSTAVIRAALARRAASIRNSSSIKFSAGGFVGWMMKTSRPRTFSSILTKISPSAKRRIVTAQSGCPRFCAISSASGRLAVPARSKSWLRDKESSGM